MKTQINMNPELKDKMKDYSKKTGMSMTTIIHLAVEKYFDSLVLSEKMKDILMKALEHEKDSPSKT